MDQHASEVYARLLLPKRLGFPLWNPTPDNNLPSEYRESGIGIGDVGIITMDGEFDFLFNICVPPDHPINIQYGVPANFEHIGSIQTSKVQGYHPRGATIASTMERNRSIDANLSLQVDPYVVFTTPNA